MKRTDIIRKTFTAFVIFSITTTVNAQQPQSSQPASSSLQETTKTNCTPEEEYLIMKKFVQVSQSICMTPSSDTYIMPYERTTSADGSEVYVPLDESFRYAWSTEFLADPENFNAFKKYARVVLYQSPLFSSYPNYHLQDASQGIIDAEKGMKLPSKDFFDKRTQREAKALELARNKTDFAAVTEFALAWLTSIQSCKDPYHKFFYYLMGHSTYEMILEKHKDFDSENINIRKIDLLLAKIRPQLTDLKEAVHVQLTKATIN